MKKLSEIVKYLKLQTNLHVEQILELHGLVQNLYFKTGFLLKINKAFKFI
jgi:hypothetical protein